ncbi:hypothetical protein P9112_004089 [Eukaryota sp. TZLM1-RC]
MHYVCYSCRTSLFTQKDLHTHSVDNFHCTTLFLSDPVWFDASSNQGKVFCPNQRCKAKLGMFNWSGVQCGCGSWVVPGFSISSQKADLVKPVDLTKLAQPSTRETC